jgi:hypothetical protein
MAMATTRWAEEPGPQPPQLSDEGREALDAKKAGTLRDDQKEALKRAEGKERTAEKYQGKRTQPAETARSAAQTMSSTVSAYTKDGFSLLNPIADSDYYSVPKLLRRVADHLDGLGDMPVSHDLWLEWSEDKDPETGEYYEELRPMITVNWPNRRKTTPPKPPNCFSTTTPEEESGHHCVPKLLRRVADHLDELGDDAAVSDVITHTEPTGEGFAPSANTYYGREEGFVRNFYPAAHELLLEWERQGMQITHDHGPLRETEGATTMAETDTTMAGTVNYLSINNPEGEPDYYSVPKLLRLVADHIDELGDGVIVKDLILHMEPTGEGYLPWINVYYYYQEDTA